MERPIRDCDVCHQQDDHPRHVIQHGPDQFTLRHLDCCAAQGCRTCVATEAITDGARGADLLAVIQSGALAEVNV